MDCLWYLRIIEITIIISLWFWAIYSITEKPKPAEVQSNIAPRSKGDLSHRLHHLRKKTIHITVLVGQDLKRFYGESVVPILQNLQSLVQGFMDSRAYSAKNYQRVEAQCGRLWQYLTRVLDERIQFNERIEEFQGVIEDLQKQVAEERAERERLHEEKTAWIWDLRYAENSLETEEAVSNGLRKDIEMKNAQCDDLSAYCRSLQQKLETAMEKIEGFRKKFEKSSKQLASSNDSLTKTQKDFKDQATRMQIRCVEIAQLKIEKKNALDRVTTLENKSKRLMTEKQQILLQMDEHSKQTVQLRRDMDKKDHALRALKRSRASLEEIATLRGEETKALGRVIEEFESRTMSLRDRFKYELLSKERLQAQMSKLESDGAKVKEVATSFRKENERHRKTILDLQHDKEESDERLKQCNARIKELERETEGFETIEWPEEDADEKEDEDEDRKDEDEQGHIASGIESEYGVEYIEDIGIQKKKSDVAVQGVGCSSYSIFTGMSPFKTMQT